MCNRPFILITFLFASLGLSGLHAEYPVRTWEISRKPVQAKLVDFTDTGVTLANGKGQQKMIGRAMLSTADEEYLRELASARKLASPIGGDDVEEAEEAMRQMAVLGKQGQLELDQAVTRWFSAEFLPLRGNLPTPRSGRPSRETVRQYNTLRERLAKAAPRVTRKEVEQLDRLWMKLEEEMSGVNVLKEPIERLGEYKRLVKDHAPSVFKRAEPVVDSLVDELQTSLDAFVPKQSAVTSSRAEAPKDPVDAFLWFYAKRQAVEKANAAAGLDDEELACVELINWYRSLMGRVPCRVDKGLLKASRGHSEDMKRMNFFSHTSPIAGKASFMDRSRAAGYDSASGENIAFGARSGEDAFWMWFSSPGHHKNILGAGHRAVAVGRYQTHWTNMFGRR